MHHATLCSADPFHAPAPASLTPQVDLLLGDPTKAKQVLGWNPERTPLEKLVQVGEAAGGLWVGWLVLAAHVLPCSSVSLAVPYLDCLLRPL